MAAAARDICDAVAILVAAGVMDYNGHASCRGDDGFWINSAASNRAAMTPAQVCRAGPDGTPLAGEARAPNEVALHAAIYAARSDVAAIVHGHPKWSTLFTLAGAPIPVVMPQGCLVAELPVYPERHSISSPERGQAVAALLGERPGILLAGHGSILTGQSLEEAVSLAIYVEQNAERAYRARALGGASAIPSAEWPDYRATLGKPGLYRKCWDFYLSERRQ